MEEFFPDWNYNTAANYAGLGLGTVDAGDDDFDGELDDILRELSSFSQPTDDSQQQQQHPTHDPLAPDQDETGNIKSVQPKSCASNLLHASRQKREEVISTDRCDPIDPKLYKIKSLGTFVEELNEELQILLFYHRKSHMKCLKYTNYLRLVKMPSFRDITNQIKQKFQTPYIAPQTDSGHLAVPSANCLKEHKLPFQTEKLCEWKPSELNKLELYVYNAYYQQQILFIESRFQQMLLEMGFTSAELNRVYLILQQRISELWTILKNERLCEERKRLKYFNLIQKMCAMEGKQFEEMVKEHFLNKDPIQPFIVKRNNTNPDGSKRCKIFIDLCDLIAWKHHEFKKLFQLRYENSEINLECVDWLMVEKEMGSYRVGSAADFKRMYEFCSSQLYNHRPMPRTELNKLKWIVTKEKKRGVFCDFDWNRIAFELKTNRSPIRLFQSYRNFIDVAPSHSIAKEYQDRLTCFLLIRQYLGHIPRVVMRLSEQRLDGVSYTKFKSTWPEINPRFAIGNFFPLEDAALLVVLEMYKTELLAGAKYSLLQYRLPWRHCQVWRRRAEFLCQNRTDVWTIEEDRLLLYAVKKYGISWPGLYKLFPTKPKYACIFRHRLLQEKLKFSTLAQYHAIYSRRGPRNDTIRLRKVFECLQQILEDINKTKYKIEVSQPHKNDNEIPDICGNIVDDEDDERINRDIKRARLSVPYNLDVSQIRPLDQDSWPNFNNPSDHYFDETGSNNENMELLDEIISSEKRTIIPRRQLQIKPVSSIDQVKLYSDWNTPSQEDIRQYLKTFDKTFVIQTLERLTMFIEYKEIVRNMKHYVSDQTLSNCDRRKFVANDPVSVASALQLRRVPLKPITSKMWEDFNEFERTVCQAYKSFSIRWKTKKGVMRRLVPTALELSFLPSIRNIIEAPKELSSQSSAVLPLSITPAVKNNLDSEKIHVPIQSIISEISSNDTSSIENDSSVEVVEANSTTIEARNALCRRVWNSENSIKMRTKCKKTRRSDLNSAAAKARWAKRAEKSQQMQDVEIGTIQEIKRDASSEEYPQGRPSPIFVIPPEILHDHAYTTKNEVQLEIGGMRNVLAYNSQETQPGSVVVVEVLRAYNLA